jgi:MarR family transcriptional regulator, transcriptional regulator for hemolysin
MTSTEILLKTSKEQREMNFKVHSVLRPYGLTPMQWAILGTVVSKPGVRIKDLSDEALSSMAYATITVNFLDAKGLVKKNQNKQDVRSVRVRPTKKALEFFEKVESEILSVLQEV